MRHPFNRAPFHRDASAGTAWGRRRFGRFCARTAPALLLVLATAGVALGAGGNIGNDFAKPRNPDFAQARELIDQGDFSGAVPLLQKVVREEERNADAYNLLGYSLRKLGRYDEALRHYTRALEIKPKHRGAHEYIGETYLALDQPEKAREHLAFLDEDCWFGCEEYDELKAAIEEYEAKGGS